MLLILVVVPLYITAATSHPDVPPSRPGFDEGAGSHKGVGFNEATIGDVERILNYRHITDALALDEVGSRRLPGWSGVRSTRPSASSNMQSAHVPTKIS
jgi:hypothetical protein